MNRWIRFFVVSLAWFCAVSFARAQEPTAAVARHLTLQEAVQLALKHNHLVRIAGYKVEESQHAKERAKSGYFPDPQRERCAQSYRHPIHPDRPGQLGTIGGVPNPDHAATLNQGGKLFITSGTQLTQPLTQLFTKVKPQNDIARANLDVSRANAQETETKLPSKFTKFTTDF